MLANFDECFDWMQWPKLSLPSYPEINTCQAKLDEVWIEPAALIESGPLESEFIANVIPIRARVRRAARQLRIALPIKKSTEERMLIGARVRAEAKKVPFDLNVRDIAIPEFCPILGLRIGNEGRDHWPSLDRVIPNLGYVRGNIRVISVRANTLKWNATADELRRIADYIDEHISRETIGLRKQEK